MKSGNGRSGVKPEPRVNPGAAHHGQKGAMEGGSRSHKDGDRRHTPSQPDGEEKQSTPGTSWGHGPNTTQAVSQGNRLVRPVVHSGDTEERPRGKCPE